MSNRGEVLVVGAGVAGAMAAYELKQAGFTPLVLETNDYIGGRAKTIRKNGFIYDTGAVGLLGSYNETKSVMQEVGLGQQFLTLKPKGAIPRDGKLRYLDMAKPVSSFLASDLYSTASKIQMLKMVMDVARLRKVLNYEQIEPLIPYDTETVQQYSKRRLNDEIYEYLTGTLTRGAWLAAAEEASVIQFLWTAKNFTPHMYSMLGGMDTLPRKLLDGINVKLNHRVLAVNEQADGVSVVYQDEQGSEHQAQFAGCVVAVPPARALDIYPQMQGAQRTFFEKAEYSRSVNVHLGLASQPDNPEIYVMMPKRECPDVTTVFLDHHKAPDRAPENKAMLSVFLRAEWCDANYESDNQQVINHVIKNLSPYYKNLENSVEDTVVQRWNECALKITPGIFKLMNDYNHSIAQCKQVQFAGDFAPFSSVNTAVVSGRAAAKRLFAAI